jgi:hypothetical protein
MKSESNLPRITGNQINWNQVFYFSEVASIGSLKEAVRVPKGAPKLQDNLYIVWAKDAENTEAVKYLLGFLPEP